jgi:hypothetical protein
VKRIEIRYVAALGVLLPAIPALASAQTDEIQSILRETTAHVVDESAEQRILHEPLSCVEIGGTGVAVQLSACPYATTTAAAGPSFTRCDGPYKALDNQG